MSGTADDSTGELVSRLSEEVAHLVRSELQLARTEVSSKAGALGQGVGMLGGAGLVALYGVGALIATAILALSLVLDAWLAALLVGAALLLIAGGVGLWGKSRVSDAVPPMPTAAVESVKKDITTLKKGNQT